jgi:hypothetical protein
MSDRHRRKTAGFVRQGEWFFIPAPKLVVPKNEIVHNEPIRRGAGKPHLCEQLCRTGGEVVWVNSKYSNGLTHSQYVALPEHERRKTPWRSMVRDARVYVRGKIRHPDHKTIGLQIWHRVVMNTETRARAMQHVAFLD